MHRSEKLASVNTKRFLSASSNYALMLFLACRYAEAEAVIRQVCAHTLSQACPIVQRPRHAAGVVEGRASFHKREVARPALMVL